MGLLKGRRKLKLTIELIPESVWGENLRKYLPKEVWIRIRKEVLKKSSYRCSICGSSEKLQCHEVWDFDDENHTLRFKGFMSLCEKCHLVKHFGVAGILASEGKVDMNELVRHFMKVNNCDLKTFEEHKKEAFRKFEERSKYEWNIDISALIEYTNKKLGEGGS